METQAIKIGRRTFAVEKTERGYMLRGVRGALYGLMRNAHRPEMLFAFNASGGYSCSLGRIWFTDADGALRVA